MFGEFKAILSSLIHQKPLMPFKRTESLVKKSLCEGPHKNAHELHVIVTNKVEKYIYINCIHSLYNF